jgi:small GTP-binding protein
MELKQSIKDDLTYKLILVGDSYVGKTYIAYRLANINYDNNSFNATIGIDIIIRKILINDQNVKLHIWDTAGQERFSFIVAQYFRCARGAIMVYDVTNTASFENLYRWLKLIKASMSEINIPIILIGNKIDKLDRVISYEIAKAFADENNMKYYEISAKQDFNHDIILSELIEQMKIDSEYDIIMESSLGQFNKAESINLNRNKMCYCCNI